MARASASRIDLARTLIELATAQRGLSEFLCANPDCRALLFRFKGRIDYVQQKCRRCGLYSELSTTDKFNSQQ